MHKNSRLKKSVNDTLRKVPRLSVSSRAVFQHVGNAQDKEVRDSSFTIAVVATMSAGKSTLLNAMIGRRLLPSCNEACTATVVRVVDHDERRDFRACRKDVNGWSGWVDEVSQELLNEWNDKAPSEILIEGNLPNIANTKNSCRVAFVDTPGPNNSSCKAHAIVTERIVANSDFSAVLFVINASVAGVEDEERLLSRLKSMFDVNPKSAKIYFVVNKIDLLDPGANESVASVLDGCDKHLRRIGFKNPLLIPTAGDLALQLRQIVNTAIPYTMGEGKPRLAKAKRDGTFEAVGSPRSLARMRRSIENLLVAKKFYRTGLRFSEEGRIALARVDHLRQNRHSKIKSLWLSGRFFTGAELRAALKMTGIPVLEQILQTELNRFSSEGGLK